MIEMTVSFSGSELGDVLRDDPEEMAYLLKEISSGDPQQLAEKVTDFLNAADVEDIKTYLNAFAAALGYSS